MYKIGVIGDRDSIYGFSAIGFNTYPVNSREEGVKTLKKLAMEKFAIIYITEALQRELSFEIEQYRTERLPAIIPIPGVFGNTGQGMLNVKKSVEKAVGSDIIFDNQN